MRDDIKNFSDCRLQCTGDFANQLKCTRRVFRVAKVANWVRSLQISFVLATKFVFVFVFLYCWNGSLIFTAVWNTDYTLSFFPSQSVRLLQNCTHKAQPLITSASAYPSLILTLSSGLGSEICISHKFLRKI